MLPEELRWMLLDKVFLALHTGIILFNLFGWIWPKTRKANMTLLLLTAFSWFGLGIWYGWGYCVFTDWHWQVLEHLQVQNLPNSYITYLLQHFTPWKVQQTVIDAATAGLFIVAFICSAFTNWRDWRNKKT